MHQKTSYSARNSSNIAKITLENVDEEISNVVELRRTFFKARRQIAKAACKVAQNHKMDLQMLEMDSDDETDNFFSGK